MAPPRYLFDRWGTCFGYVDDAGRYFDAEGRQVGNIRGEGEVYDRTDKRCGRIDVQGQLWNQQGISLGYLGPKVPARPTQS